MWYEMLKIRTCWCCFRKKYCVFNELKSDWMLTYLSLITYFSVTFQLSFCNHSVNILTRTFQWQFQGEAGYNRWSLPFACDGKNWGPVSQQLGHGKHPSLLKGRKAYILKLFTGNGEVSILVNNYRWYPINNIQ